MRILLAQSNGLGNQLFQYASALFFSRQLGVDFEVLEEPESSIRNHGFPIMLAKFCVKAPIRPMSKWDRLMFSRVKRNQAVALPARILSRNQVVFQERFVDYSFPEELRLHPLTRKLYLFGYLQSHRVPDAIEPELREHLEFRDAPTGRNLDVLRQIEECRSPVSLHVRRGDYTRVHGGKDALPLTYHRNAMEVIREQVADPTFFVFSDEIDYCREHLPHDAKVVFVDHNDALHCHEDLRLMAACRHNIIANSSFSWWGAWLNANPGKVVCAPNVWRDEAISRHILPPEWIRCDVRREPARVPRNVRPPRGLFPVPAGQQVAALS